MSGCILVSGRGEVRTGRGVVANRGWGALDNNVYAAEDLNTTQYINYYSVMIHQFVSNFFLDITVLGKSHL